MIEPLTTSLVHQALAEAWSSWHFRGLTPRQACLEVIPRYPMLVSARLQIALQQQILHEVQDDECVSATA